MSKEISIITTVYNGSKYLEQCLDSIMAQTFRDFELILVDDGSTDTSGEIADRYANDYPEMISVIHQKNGGLSNARNTGIEYINGEYIAFVDADDRIEPDYLDRFYLVARQNDSDCVVCGYTRVDDNGKILGVRNATEWEMRLDDGINHEFSYIACARLYKTDFIRKSGMRFSDGEGFEDVPFNIYMNITASNCIAIDYAGYLYRVNSDSITEKVKKNGTAVVSKVMKFPYRGLENTIVKIRQNYGSKYDDILYYEIIKNFAGLLFFVSKSSSDVDIKKVSDFEQSILHKYFDGIKASDISYFRMNRFKKLPYSYRAAVKIYLCAYNRNAIYRLALIYRRFTALEKFKRV